MKILKESLRKILPSPLWNLLRRTKKALTFGFRYIFELLGYNISRVNDYSSPLPLLSNLKKNITRWYKPSGLAGIQYDLKELEDRFSKILSNYNNELIKLPNYFEIYEKGYGYGFSPLDALILYVMIRHYKPNKYIEIGSGISTYYCSLAAKKNNEDGYPLDITCIEPYPYKKLCSIPNIDIIEKEAQNVDISFFNELQENDILFIDSSHILKIDGDVPYIYLEILPALKKNVLIHIHDVPFPYNIPYPPENYVFGRNWPFFYNEAMVVQAFLCFNDIYKIIMSIPLIRYFDEEFLKKHIHNYESIHQYPYIASSIWIRKLK